MVLYYMYVCMYVYNLNILFMCNLNIHFKCKYIYDSILSCKKHSRNTDKISK